MERRAFLKTTLGIAAGFAALSVSAHASPLMRQADPLAGAANGKPEPAIAPQPAVADQNDIEAARVEQVRWGRRRRWRRRFGWRRRRFWGRRRWRRRRFWL